MLSNSPESYRSIYSLLLLWQSSQIITQAAFTCSKVTLETLEQGAKYVSKLTIRHQNDFILNIHSYKMSVGKVHEYTELGSVSLKDKIGTSSVKLSWRYKALPMKHTCNMAYHVYYRLLISKQEYFFKRGLLSLLSFRVNFLRYKTLQN